VLNYGSLGGNMPETKLAEFLKSSRTSANLSQKDVSTKLGYGSSQFISNWERGVSQPPIKVLKVLSNLYKVEADKIFDVLLEDTVEIVKADLRSKFDA
jgi:transcriptional regulator with XRE-family HTH domain